MVKYVIGADEVGRGPLAGGCYVGAVMAPTNIAPIPGVNDSKKLRPATRQRLHKAITEHPGLDHRIAIRTASRVDDVGIQKALVECFWEAIEGLLAIDPMRPIEAIRIDGKPIAVDFRPIPTEFIVKGDAKDWVIGAASIVAKVERDAYMTKMARQYPQYGWEGNKGYGSPGHIEAIKEHGLTPLHRVTFCRNFVKHDDIGDILDMFGGD